MPVVLVNLSPAVFEEIRNLVDRGLYSRPEQFLEIAASNQVALERGATPEQVLAGDHRKAVATEPMDAKPSHTVADFAAIDAEGEVLAKRALRLSERRYNAVTARELGLALGHLDVRKCAEFRLVSVHPDPRPLDERISGLVNRVFPLKLACRWMVVANAGKRKWDTYDSIGRRLAEDASTIGSALGQLDEDAKRKRDELLSTGLPRRMILASRDRFLNQFIARTTRAGEVFPGAICQYGLAEFNGDRLTLTSRGVDLARLPSSVLDGDLREARDALSPEERTFFVEQIQLFVPSERRDFALVVAAVEGGHATPKQLIASIQPAFPPSWSESVLRTHVSGVVGRLTELGGLRRRWEGRHVSYELTDDIGRSFLGAGRSGIVRAGAPADD